MQSAKSVKDIRFAKSHKSKRPVLYSVPREYKALFKQYMLEDIRRTYGDAEWDVGWVREGDHVSPWTPCE